MTTDRTDHVLAAIDGALADDQWDDAMRWSPRPDQVDDAGAPYGEDPWPYGPFVGVSLATPDHMHLDLRPFLARALEDEAARIRRAESMRVLMEAVAGAWRQVQDQLNTWGSVMAEASKNMHTLLREAGAIPDEPPTDPRARALHLRQHRNTGPAHPAGQNAHRPRSHR